MTKIRKVKTWETATSLKELKVLFKNSKENTDVSLLLKQYKAELNDSGDETTTSVDSPKKRKIHDDGDTSSEPKKIRKKNDRTKVKNMENFLRKTDSLRVQVKNPLPDLFKGIMSLFATSEPTQAERYLNPLIVTLIGKVVSFLQVFYCVWRNHSKTQKLPASQLYFSRQSRD